MSSYNVFAKYYDELTANIDYKKRAEYFDLIINKHKKTDGVLLLDLACGTGSISEEMAKLNYNVIGVDYSIDMLSIAANKKYMNNSSVQYICQDMCKLNLPQKTDITICALDSINHLKSFDDVKAAFNKISHFSKENALFIFDINTIYKHQCILANNTFTYETDDVYCIWENTLNEADNTVSINLEFFERDGKIYHRSSESFKETAYTLNEINSALNEAGFEVIANYDDDSFNPPNDKSQRIVVTARKK